MVTGTKQEGSRTMANEQSLPSPAAVRGERRGFFDIYKPGQGYYTRMGSALGAGVMTLWACGYLHGKLELLGTTPTAQYLQTGISVAVGIVLGLFIYRLLALNRRVCDFLIATEGEMNIVDAVLLADRRAAHESRDPRTAAG
jgi:hypothetical protein